MSNDDINVIDNITTDTQDAVSITLSAYGSRSPGRYATLFNLEQPFGMQLTLLKLSSLESVVLVASCLTAEVPQRRTK